MRSIMAQASRDLPILTACRSCADLPLRYVCAGGTLPADCQLRLRLADQLIQLLRERHLVERPRPGVDLLSAHPSLGCPEQILVEILDQLAPADARQVLLEARPGRRVAGANRVPEPAVCNLIVGC